MNDVIVDIQTQLAFQDTTIEELNQVITDQQQQLDKLYVEVEVLKTQMQSLQMTDLIHQADETPPPHY